MSEVSKAKERARAVLDDLLRCESGLWDRELKFIEDMDKKRHLDWTDKQVAWLDKIYDRVC